MGTGIARAALAAALLAGAGCAEGGGTGDALRPAEIVDLGALVTEDLPERVWGPAMLADRGWSRPNHFEEMPWELAGGTASNAYYTLFNHGGPHVDAPKHIGLPGGIDGYPIDAFIGPARVFDVRGFSAGRSVGPNVFIEGDVQPGDVVLIYTGYEAPRGDAYPSTITITRAAAAYLASLPIRAFGTDAWSVANLDDPRPVEADTALARAVPNHEAFLSARIPIYEQLFRVDELLDKGRMLFVGAPLNIRDGDGMIVRPVVLVY